MIYRYGISLKGDSHEKSNTVCQDAHAIISCGNDIAIAAVADGLGSAEYSDTASKLAVDVSTRYCEQKIDVIQSGNTDEILRIIQVSFGEALNAIESKAEEQGHDIVQYHTTLTLALLVKDTLYYGHSGDSGIIALTLEGRFEIVTEQQRDEYGYVFPLFFEDRWGFGQFEKKVCSILLATDGMLLPLIPHLLKNEAVKINVNMAGNLMDNRCLNIDKDGEDAVKTRIKDYITNNMPREAVEGDDLTIAVLVNTSIDPGTQSEDYYKQDWEELKRKYDEEFQRELYPHSPGDDQDVTNAPENNIDKQTGFVGLVRRFLAIFTK